MKKILPLFVLGAIAISFASGLVFSKTAEMSPPGAIAYKTSTSI